MNENYILLPSEVEHELNYVLPDPSITIELIAKLLENTGWQNKSQKTHCTHFPFLHCVPIPTEKQQKDLVLIKGSYSSLT